MDDVKLHVRQSKQLRSLLSSEDTSLIRDVSSPVYLADLSNDTIRRISQERRELQRKEKADAAVKLKALVYNELCLADENNVKDEEYTIKPPAIMVGDTFESIKPNLGSFTVAKLNALAHVAHSTTGRSARYAALLDPDIYCRVRRGTDSLQIDDPKKEISSEVNFEANDIPPSCIVTPTKSASSGISYPNTTTPYTPLVQNQSAFSSNFVSDTFALDQMPNGNIFLRVIIVIVVICNFICDMCYRF